MAIRVVGVRQLRDELASVLEDLASHDEVIVTQRGEGRAVLIALGRYNELIERLEYLEDSLAAAEASWQGARPLRDVLG